MRMSMIMMSVMRMFGDDDDEEEEEDSHVDDQDFDDDDVNDEDDTDDVDIAQRHLMETCNRVTNLDWCKDTNQPN